MSRIANKTDLAAKVAIECKDMAGFEGDINIAQAQHVMASLRRVLNRAAMAGQHPRDVLSFLDLKIEVQNQIGWSLEMVPIDTEDRPAG